MSSPFEVFRRHQIMTVVLIGLAMLAFVIFGAISDPREIPPALWILAFASILGGVMWILGLKEKKQNEWGITGALAGLAMATAFAYASRPAAAVTIEGGDLTEQALAQKSQDLGVANAFLQTVFAISSGEQQRMPSQYLFGFGEAQSEGQARRLVIDWELLGREADRLGIEVSNDAVNAYLNEVTSGRVRRNHVAEARQRYNLSEPQLYQILRNNIAARTALLMLFPQFEMPPQQYYDFYQRLNEQRELQVIKLPVADFAKELEEPTEQELLSTFEAYRGNVANYTPDGRFVAGQPGFYQGNRVKLGYVEFPFEAIKGTIAAPTDEEIQAEYDARYKRQLEDPFKDAPALPDPEAGTDPGAEVSKPEMKATEEASAESKPADSPEQPEEKKTEKPAGEAAGEEKPAAEKPASEPSTDESKPAEETKPAEPKSEEAKPEGETSLLIRDSRLMPVAFIQDEPAEKPAAETPAAEEAPEEKPVAEPKASDKPAETKPAEEATEKKAAPEGEKPAAEGESKPADAEMKKEEAKPATDEPKPADAPAEAEEKKDGEKTNSEKKDGEAPAMELKPDGEAAKKTDEPPTLEEVREEIVNDLVETKTLNKQNELIQAALSKMLTLESQLALTADAAEGLSVAQINEQLSAWAKENGGVYNETSLLSGDELAESEDHPIGKAFSGRDGTVASVAIRTPEGSILNAREAIDFQTKSSFAWWVIETLPPHVPQSIDEPGVRSQVVEAVQKSKALPKAEARAAELAEKVRAAEGDAIQELFTETTVTGAEGGDYVSVQSTGPITWMSQDRMQTNPFMNSGATVTDLSPKLGLELPVGGDFMETAFRGLAPGEVGVTTNYDKSVVFVVRVKPDENAASEPADEFLKAPLFQPWFVSPYSGMASEELRKFQPNALADLERKYGVEFN